MSKLIDLTHTFDDGMPAYPGDPCPKLYQIASISEDGYTDYIVETGMHVGTHMDAPLHMIEGGKFLSDVSIQSFTGIGHLLDAREKGLMTPDLIEGHDLSSGDIVLLMTGFFNHFYESKYYETFPEMSEELAECMVNLSVSIVGMDTPSPDRSPNKVHKILLGNEVLIIENLNNLEALVNAGRFRVHAYPPKFHSEAAPVRVVAEIL